eukprot:150642_1
MGINWILCISSCSILFVLWITSLLQLFFADFFRDRVLIRRILLSCVNVFCFLILNLLVYLVTFYPHTVIFLNLNVTTLYIIFQAFISTLGFHTFRILFIFVINTVYNQTTINVPKWLTYFVNGLEIFVICAIVITHTLAILFNNTDFILIFFITFGIQAFIMASMTTWPLFKPLKLLNNILNAKDGYDRTIESAIIKIKVAIFVSIFSCILAIIVIIATIEQIEHYFHWSYDFQLVTNIMYSTILTVFSFALILWIYKTENCCKCSENSVCMVWCYADIKSEYSNSNNMKAPMVLQESTGISTNTNVIPTCTVTTITTLNDETQNTSTAQIVSTETT